MLGTAVRCRSHLRNINGVCVMSNNGVGKVLYGIGYQKRNYSKKYDNKIADCCKEISQTKGKKVEPWPKADPPPPAWRCECPQGPQPPTYDPYRIKVPDVVVPPLPPSNAKVAYSPLVRPLREAGPARGRPPRRRVTQRTPLCLKPPMLECARTRGPCSAKPSPDPPPCPPPPIKPFSWVYLIVTGAFLAFVGGFYKWYLYREEQELLGESKPIWRPRRKIKRPYHDKDLPACVQYLIVGTGAAGWAAYRSIMQHDQTAKVFFISKEDVLPYKRPPMSKNMWWNAEPPEIRTLNYIEEGKRVTMYQAECRHFMDPVKFYRKKIGPAVSIATGWCVLRVDADDHVAWVKTMCGEAPIYYERCLLALGSKAKNMMIFKTASKAIRERVCILRSIRDLEIAYRKVQEAKHVTIIGAGCLGTELAWHIGRMHKEWFPPPEEEHVPVKVLHVFKDPGILAGILPEYLSEWAVEKLKCQDVIPMPKTLVYDAYESPDGRLDLTLSNGTTVTTDYVFVCIGAKPRTEIAEASDLEVDKVNDGFMVNTELEARTHLYVAGDAASFYSQWKQLRQRFEHYINAEEQGFVAGANMTGYWTPCNMEQHFWIRLGNELQVEVIGDVGACMQTIGIFKPCDDDPVGLQYETKTGEFEKPCYKESTEYRNRYKRGMVFYLKGETIVGMVFWNFPPIEDRMEVVTEMLRARPTYRDINLLAELLGFSDLECVYIPEEEIKVQGPCVKNWKYP